MTYMEKLRELNSHNVRKRRLRVDLAVFNWWSVSKHTVGANSSAMRRYAVQR